MTDTISDDPLFNFVLYLVTSARLTLDERAIYGSFRLIEGASRLIESAEDVEGLDPDGFLQSVRDSIEQNKARMMLDKEGFREWLTDLAAGMASEAVTRSLETVVP